VFVKNPIGLNLLKKKNPVPDLGFKGVFWGFY
jgi:hypothetical protein